MDGNMVDQQVPEVYLSHATVKITLTVLPITTPAIMDISLPMLPITITMMTSLFAIQCCLLDTAAQRPN